MGRLKELRKAVDGRLQALPDPDKRLGAINHLYGVSLSATILAKKRGLNDELAAMAAMLHDLYAYESGSYEDHAHLGSGLAREILDSLGLTTPEETEEICRAIYCHDDKAVTDGPLEEYLKDADVLHHCLNDVSKPVKEKEQKRYEALKAELGLS